MRKTKNRRQRHSAPKLGKQVPKGLDLPGVVPHEGLLKNCCVCGAEPTEESPDFEYLLGDGMKTMLCDQDLCMECAIHVWRAFKELHPSDYARIARDLLREYSVTRAHVPAEGAAADA